MMTRLQTLMLEGTVWTEGDDYVGRASDGVVVALGGIGYETQLENYLVTYSGPETW